MKTLEDEIRHILDYDSEETVALTFKCKARLVKNIVSTVENHFSQPSDVSDEELGKTVLLVLAQIKHNEECGKDNKFTIDEVMSIIKRHILPNKSGQIKPTIEVENKPTVLCPNCGCSSEAYTTLGKAHCANCGKLWDFKTNS